MNTASALPIAQQAAKNAGEVLRDAFQDGTEATAETSKDIKTQADLDADEAIASVLRETQLPIVSEESAHRSPLPAKGYCWIVDPLDGTVNFLRGVPLACTSIALWRDGEPLLGVIYDFLREELFWGGPELPSVCNSKRIEVSKSTLPRESVIATGFPNARDYNRASLLHFVSLIQRFRKVRLLGSAALSLAWLAQSKVDAYFEEDIYLWDIAAGLPIALGAGAVCQQSETDAATMKLTLRVASTDRLLRSTTSC